MGVESPFAIETPKGRICCHINAADLAPPTFFLVFASSLLAAVSFLSLSLIMMELRGAKLELAQMLMVVLPSFILFGYNQSGVGGLLSIESWVETFPQIDTIHTTGKEKSTNSTVQVRWSVWIEMRCLADACFIRV